MRHGVGAHFVFLKHDACCYSTVWYTQYSHYVCMSTWSGLAQTEICRLPKTVGAGFRIRGKKKYDKIGGDPPPELSHENGDDGSTHGRLETRTESNCAASISPLLPPIETIRDLCSVVVVAVVIQICVRVLEPNGLHWPGRLGRARVRAGASDKRGAPNAPKTSS